MSMRTSYSKRVMLGPYLGYKQIWESLRARGVGVTPAADNLLRQLPIKEEHNEARVEVLSVHALHETAGCKYQDLVVSGRARGLFPGPADLGPSLCLADLGLEDGEWVYAISAPITAPDKSIRLFGFGMKSGKMVLGLGNGKPDYYWHPAKLVAFIREDRS